MAKTPSSTKSESVTLRIPNELFAQIKAIAESNTRGNTSQAILQLLEAGLSVVSSSTRQTVNDSSLQPQLIETRETVTALADQVDQLTRFVQDTVLQRLTEVETELMGESVASRAENESLRQQHLIQMPDLAKERERFLSRLKVGKQSPEYKRTRAVIDRFMATVTSAMIGLNE